MYNPETRATNAAYLEGFQSSDPYLQKEATEGVQDFLRMRAREDGAYRHIQPPIKVTREDLNKSLETKKPCIIKDKEPNSAGAISIPFGSVPMNHYMDAPRYIVTFDRIVTKRYRADVGNLLMYDLDIRKIFNDLMLKDMMYEEDERFLTASDTAVGDLNDADSTHVDNTGAYGYVSVGAMNRVSLANAMRGLGETDNKLAPAKALINHNTVWDVVAQGRDTIGGDLAERLFTDGFVEKKIMGLDWVVTIKHDLVENDIMYMYTSPDALGDFFILEDVTVWTKHEAYMFEMFAYSSIGGIIGNEAGVAKVSFTGSFSGWRPSTGSSS